MEELKFKVDSALLKELGEKLVESVQVALSELVKNAYDADATEVEVVFGLNEKGEEQIKIIDNGTGMSFDAVESYWMRIATTNKEKKQTSVVFGRPLTGAKGIGRFSCRRLGDKLTLITNGTKDGDCIGEQENIQQTKVVFDWTKFTAGKDITTIKCPGIKKQLARGITGTTLIIDGIDKGWNMRGFNWLKRQLAVLTANRGAIREGFEEDEGFDILLEVPDLEGGVRDLRDDFLKAGWGTLTAYINSKHQAVCELDALGLGRRTIISNIVFPNLKDISLEVGIMVDDRGQLRDTTVLSKGTLSTIIKTWGGVHVRYRGFRVYPYGNDDWLNIDRDRGLRKARPKIDELFAFAASLRGVDEKKALLNMLSMNNYIGNVNIGQKATGFEMKTSREGFLDSPSVKQLGEFTRFAIDWANIVREQYIRQKKIHRAEIAREELQTVVSSRVDKGRVVDTALDYLESRIKSITQTLKSEEERLQIESSVQKATEAIRTHNDAVRIELSHLRLVASTSSLVLIFSHEVKSLLGLLEQSKNSLNDIAKSLEEGQQKIIEKISNNFTNLNHRLEELLQLTSLISKNKIKTEPGRVALKSRLVKVDKIFELITGKYDIDLDYSEVPNKTIIKNILEAELYSILINVVSNSIKAVIAGGQEKKIKIDAKFVNGENVISIYDTGIGLSPSRYEEVFTPFIADPDGILYTNLEEKINPEDNIIVGNGTGLGLGIVKEIVDAHGGSIRFKEPKSGWSTEMEIKLT